MIGAQSRCIELPDRSCVVHPEAAPRSKGCQPLRRNATPEINATASRAHGHEIERHGYAMKWSDNMDRFGAIAKTSTHGDQRDTQHINE